MARLHLAQAALRLAALALMAASASAASAPSIPAQETRPTGVRYDAAHQALDIPFEIHNNHIYVQARINASEPAWFVLDTGSVTVLDTAYARRLGLKAMGRGEAGAPSAGPPCDCLRNVDVGLPGCHLHLAEVDVLPLHRLGRVSGRGFEGILGRDLFENCVVDIDYQSQRMSVYDPTAYRISLFNCTASSVLEEFKDRT